MICWPKINNGVLFYFSLATIYQSVYFKTKNKKEETKEQIIKIAAELFNKKGYEATSLSDITEATGLTKGSIYGNFENKLSVAVATFKYSMEIQRKGLREELSHIESPRLKLLHYLDFMGKSFKRISNRGGCVILNTAIEVDDGNKELKKLVLRSLQSWKKLLVHIIDSGKSDGEFDKKINAEDKANFFIALIEGSIMYARITKNENIIKNNISLLKREIDLMMK